ncbi:MAG: NUDIX domain-containing protein [Rhodospirillaceae bacterium]|nr:NUDIX domain-containing protein [Rhodospirillaceae bacterium]
MGRDDVEIVSTESCHSGFFRLERVHLRHRRFDGDWSQVFQRELLRTPGAVAALPYDPHADAVVLVEQFRLGAHLAGHQPWLIEVIGGMLDHDEPPEAVARRESMEEAGLEVTAVEPIMHYFPTPGTTSEVVHMFCVRVDSTGAGGIHGLASEHEDIRVAVMSVDGALALLAEGRIVNAHTVIALQWLALNRDRLRAAWLRDGLAA